MYLPARLPVRLRSFNPARTSYRAAGCWRFHVEQTYVCMRVRESMSAGYIERMTMAMFHPVQWYTGSGI